MTAFFHPSRKAFRYIMLGTISMICFGTYFSYDEIQSIGDDLKQYLNINDGQFLILYSVYSIPNTVLVFFGGYFGDYFGLRTAGILFVTLSFTGTTVVALAAFTKKWAAHDVPFYVMAVGRFIFGMGAESLNVTQSSMIAKWFSDGTELATAFGLTLSLSRLGDYLAIVTGDRIANATGSYRWTLWVGVMVVGLSYLAVVTYCILDIAAGKKLPPRPMKKEEIRFSAVLHFDKRFFLIAFITMTYYAGVLPFTSLATNFIKAKWGPDTLDNKFVYKNASTISGIVVLASIVLSPLLGKLVDIVGHRPYFILLGSFIMIPAHCLLGALNINPIYSFIAIGLSFSLVPSALWPCIPLIIKEENTATAFGLMTSIQNAGLAIVALVVGQIVNAYVSATYDKHEQVKGYNYAMAFFVCMDCIGFLLTEWLIIVDHYSGKTLCKRAKAKATDDEAVGPLLSDTVN